MSGVIKLRQLVTNILLTTVVSILSAMASGPIADAYHRLLLPPWAPAAEMFSFAWTVLALFMGTACYMATMNMPKPKRWYIYIAQLVQILLLAVWAPLFFRYGNFTLCFWLAVLLAGAVLANMFSFWQLDTRAGMLLIPALCWAICIACLAFDIVQLN